MLVLMLVSNIEIESLWESRGMVQEAEVNVNVTMNISDSQLLR